MKKRRTIGENPLDAEFTENPLDTVVPLAEGGRPTPAEPPARQRELEEELAAARAEIAGLKAELAAQQAKSSNEPWWLGRLKEKLADK
jgi:hypothetical protein